VLFKLAAEKVFDLPQTSLVRKEPLIASLAHAEEWLL
jgi:hypothetical protein